MYIKLSHKHGVNPSVMTCFYCGKDTGVALLGRLPGDEKAPHQAVFSMEPCDKCKDFMKQGIICISVKDGEDGNNPYRTGGWVVIKEDAVKRLVNGEELLADILKRRVAFLPDEVWKMLGLPGIQ